MLKKLLVSLSFFIVCESALAADYYRDRVITGVGIYHQGGESVLLIDISGTKDALPTCASSGRLAISSSAPHYKETVALAMAAKISGDTAVAVYVTGTCNYFGNAQDILGVKMGDIAW